MKSVFQVGPGSVDEMMLTTFTAQHSSEVRSGPRASETAVVMRKNGVTVDQPIELFAGPPTSSVFSSCLSSEADMVSANMSSPWLNLPESRLLRASINLSLLPPSLMLYMESKPALSSPPIHS